MDIKMKCMQMLGREKCKNSGTHTCADCKTQELFCFPHSGIHKMETQHRIIENKSFLYLKFQIKTSISSMAQYTSNIIAEIRRTSLKAIIQLKRASKNIKNIKDFFK